MTAQRRLRASLVFGVVALGACAAWVSAQSGASGVFSITFLIIILLVCSASDLHVGLVFDCVTIPALVILLVLAAFQGEIFDAVFGAAVAGGALLILHVLTRGNGMGLGDVKLAAVIGAGLGAQDAAIALGAAFVIGALVGICLLITHRARRESELCFAPFLALGVYASITLGSVLR